MRHRYEGYDLSGNVTVLRDSRNSDQYQCFTYDTMDRLTDACTASACDGDPDHTGEGWFNHSELEGGDGYDYDTIGNITDLSGTAYTYAETGNAGPHAPTQVGSVVFTYDQNGNRLTSTDGSDVTDYEYDHDNRLTDITLPDSTALRFWYDADGQRVRRRNTLKNTYYVGGLMEVDMNGSTTVTETRTLYSFGGLPVAVRTHVADEITFLFTDHLGSVTSAWNDTTDTLTLTRYFPYGGERHSTAEMPQDQRYTGQVSDATANASGGSGLLYYNARYYDPVTAQFTQPDTIVPDPSSPADLNRFAYVRGNPVRFVDPSGHCTIGVSEIWERPAGGCDPYTYARRNFELYVYTAVKDGPTARYWETANADPQLREIAEFGSVLLVDAGLPDNELRALIAGIDDRTVLTFYNDPYEIIAPHLFRADAEMLAQVMSENPSMMLSGLALLGCARFGPQFCQRATLAVIGATSTEVGFDIADEHGPAAGVAVGVATAVALTVINAALDCEGCTGFGSTPATAASFDWGTFAAQLQLFVIGQSIGPVATTVWDGPSR
jgi:RHS repeat-associated protein